MVARSLRSPRHAPLLAQRLRDPDHIVALAMIDRDLRHAMDAATVYNLSRLDRLRKAL